MLHIRSLTKSFTRAGNRAILRSVNLDVPAGEFVAITGESGAGKSTLLNLIAGLDKPDAGSIEFEGHELTTLDDDALTRLRRDRMGFVFQAFHLLPYLSVAQNVALPLALMRRGAVLGEVTPLLTAVGLADRANSFPAELSGGEMQRVAIARALVHSPALLLVDEPTGNLDADNAAQILQLLSRQVRERGAAAILVTHSATAAACADRILQLRHGGLA